MTDNPTDQLNLLLRAEKEGKGERARPQAARLHRGRAAILRIAATTRTLHATILRQATTDATVL